MRQQQTPGGAPGNPDFDYAEEAFERGEDSAALTAATMALVREQRTANLIALRDIGSLLDPGISVLVRRRLGVTVLDDDPTDQPSPSTPQALAEAADPASADFADQVEEVAENLWKADPGKKTAARSFSEDYAAAQDRYREMATNLLDPSGSEDPER